MNVREPVCKPSAACPVTETAGSALRRRDIAGFSITEAVYAEGVSLPRHCHAESYLTLVLAGAYIETYGDREHQRNEGALHLLPSGEGHANRFPVAARLLRVRIHPAVMDRLGREQTEYLSEPRDISGPLAAWLANRMIREFVAQDDSAPLAMEGVLLEMLAETARSSTEGYGSSAPSWLQRVRECLEDTYLQAPGLATLAADAGVHPVHLSREFHKHYRITVGDFIRSRRIEHASELLSNADLSLGEIATICGFSDQSHFCATFKKHWGMTPAKFRDSSAPARARWAKA